MSKRAIAIAVAAIVCAGPAHAGPRETMLFKAAQLLKDYGKSIGIELTAVATVHGLEQLWSKKEDHNDELNRKVEEALQRLLANREFLERQIRELVAYLQRWDWCSNPSYAAANSDAAIEACSEIVRSEGETAQNTATAYYNRGVAYGEKGDHDRAIADYTKAIDIDPGYAMAYNNRGWTYGMKGDYDRESKDYEGANEIARRLRRY